ncbi:endoglucanase-like isoform X2 [Biomphalaria pfeifferi]|uniref:Endoglucanase-like isoform X2 n=1 Tax=Biomphalaria pfeifferi TaxID=112525 RepID=A0AAD8FM13_BIOPF|nr:endoglucanase-like isoform X2 [Biomphalaria pfeifferi]
MEQRQGPHSEPPDLLIHRTGKTFISSGRIVYTYLIGVVLGSSRCHNDSYGILKYSGLPCTKVRLYTDNHKGACGCGPTDLDAPFDPNLTDYVAAPNQKFFDDGGNNAFCGHNCGQCVKLTPTGGGYGAVLGPPPVTGKPGTNSFNLHGFEVQFNLQNHRGQVTVGLGCDNPEPTAQTRLQQSPKPASLDDKTTNSFDTAIHTIIKETILDLRHSDGSQINKLTHYWGRPPHRELHLKTKQENNDSNCSASLGTETYGTLWSSKENAKQDAHGIEY